MHLLTPASPPTASSAASTATPNGAPQRASHPRRHHPPPRQPSPYSPALRPERAPRRRQRPSPPHSQQQRQSRRAPRFSWPAARACPPYNSDNCHHPSQPSYSAPATPSAALNNVKLSCSTFSRPRQSASSAAQQKTRSTPPSGTNDGAAAPVLATNAESMRQKFYVLVTSSRPRMGRSQLTTACWLAGLACSAALRSRGLGGSQASGLASCWRARTRRRR